MSLLPHSKKPSSLECLSFETALEFEICECLCPDYLIECDCRPSLVFFPSFELPFRTGSEIIYAAEIHSFILSFRYLFTTFLVSLLFPLVHSLRPDYATKVFIYEKWWPVEREDGPENMNWIASHTDKPETFRNMTMTSHHYERREFGMV